MTGEEAYREARGLWASMGAMTDGPWPLWDDLSFEERAKWQDIANETNTKIVEDMAHDYRY